ncbi:helix-turn-helix domain-containing protein [Polymorphospora sp. NPDC051019]|uniref:helix-turn-helix domain-containing protein n=1 Tax=Polymorphospora sp. NPDC051019 TaxID=3155725 RepID=UPI003422CBB6
MAKRVTGKPAPVPALPTELLTIEEAADRIKMSVRYLRRAVAERRIAFHRLGRSIRFDPADLAAFVQASRVEPMTAETVWRELRSVA